MSFKWLERETVLAVHAQQFAEHGGARGLRDMGLLESALARPSQLAAYGEPSLYDLAAAYAWGRARTPPFIDGNKRTAYVSCMLILRLHGVRVSAGGAEKVLLFVRLGKGGFSQGELARWLKERSSPPAP